jgi:mRNA-degrading endonuclease RelE of RelBE toxin-antitoxin system
MRFVIILAPEAIDDLNRLKTTVQAVVRAALETHLRHEPKKISRSRIKRLRGLRRPQYRLRVGDIRVFYDVSDSTVEILAIVTKSETESWLAQFGSPA